MKCFQHIWDKILIINIVLIMMIGLVTTIAFPDDINYYESRSANKVVDLNLNTYINKEFQVSMEDALSDQVQLSILAKQIYNKAKAAIPAFIFNTVIENSFDYVQFEGKLFYKGRAIFGAYSLNDIQQSLVSKAENYSQCFTSLPDVDFYVYYIEKDTDIDFKSNEKIMAYEYIKEALYPVLNSRISRFEISDFMDFSEYFYKTDHHWNYLGSYKGYLDVLNLMGDYEPMLPIETIALNGRFSGSKLIGIEPLLSEEVMVYKFNWPALSISINGVEVFDYGNQDAFINGDMSGFSYGKFYGGDDAEIIFDTHNDGENLLVIGESYDNAILKLLSSNFAKTYSIDLRYYSHTINKPFDIKSYIAENEIDKVLLIGNIDYFIMNEFEIGD